MRKDVYAGHWDWAVAREIKALRERGLRVALDSFGTGHASLGFVFSKAVDRHATAELLRRHAQTDGALPFHTTKKELNKVSCAEMLSKLERLDKPGADARRSAGIY